MRPKHVWTNLETHCGLTGATTASDSQATMNPTFCIIAHPDTVGRDTCAATDTIDIEDPAVQIAIGQEFSRASPAVTLSFDYCLYNAALAAGNAAHPKTDLAPFDLAGYKAACGKERATYNAAKYKNPLFDLDHCGKYKDGRDQSACWVREGKMPVDFKPHGEVISG